MDKEKLEHAKKRFHLYAPHGEPDDCWVWKGPVDHDGYGRFKAKGIVYRAHRFSLSLQSGLPSAATMACHHCDNRLCVNPAHLYWGTAADNAHDMVSRGRNKTVFEPKLKPHQVEEIREAIANGETQRTVAERYSVSQAAVHQIVAGKTWRFQ